MKLAIGTLTAIVDSHLPRRRHTVGILKQLIARPTMRCGRVDRHGAGADEGDDGLVRAWNATGTHRETAYDPQYDDVGGEETDYY